MNEARFYVTSEKKCDRCEGNGWVYNKAWREFTSAVNAALDEEERTGIRAILPDSKLFEREHGAEELVCGDCEGSGTVTRRVELGEALESLGITQPA